MSRDMIEMHSRLSSLWQSYKVPVLDLNRKYFLFSDIHLGDGKGADDFHRNESALSKALDYYQNEDFHLILNGDVEEFWQFNQQEINHRYQNSVYHKIRAFGDDRLHRIYGNHDDSWCVLCDPIYIIQPEIKCAVEAIKIRKDGRNRFLLVHGHQGCKKSDKASWLSRFAVRIYRYIEPVCKEYLGITLHPQAARSQIVKGFDRHLYSWAKKNKVILICGHSHRAIFAAKSYSERLKDDIRRLKKENIQNRFDENKKIERNAKIKEMEKELKIEKKKKREVGALDPDGDPLPCYFNTGCGLYSDGITGIEIADGYMNLVKWNRDGFEGPKYEVYHTRKLDEILDLFQ